MRVLHLLDTTGPGGAETVFLTLLTSLGPEWENIPVVAGPGWVEDAVRGAGLSPLMIGSSGRLDLPYLRALIRTMRAQEIDLVQTHLFSTTLYGGVAGRVLGIPVISTFHGNPDLRATGWQGQLKYRLIRSCTSKVVCVSAALRDRTMEMAGFRKEELAVIPNGIDTELYRPGDFPELKRELGLPPETFLVGSVGNVRPAKDYATLLRTAAVARKRLGEAVRFVVVGQRTPPLYDQLLALRAELGLEDTVTFLGFQENVPELLRGLDLFLLTSAHEGFSLVTVQAMATGLPVVATRSGGPEVILTHEKDGILVPSQDPSALAEAIGRFKSSPESRKAFGKAARRTAMDRFSTAVMVKAYEGLYREGLEESRLRAHLLKPG